MRIPRTGSGWPANEFCREILERLGKASFPYEVRHVSNFLRRHLYR